MAGFPIRATVCLCLAILVLTPAAPAHAESIFNYLFPSIFGPPEKGPHPEDTLVAPFAQDPNQKPLSLQEKIARSRASTENLVPIDQPHRSSKYIAQWAAEKVADALTFDGHDADAHFKAVDAYFVPSGKQEFQTYLVNSHMLENLQSQQQRMQAFTKTDPNQLNEGNFSGVYRWLYDVPVTVSLIPSSMTSYSSKLKVTPVTQDLVVRLQIGRVKDGFADGIAIERWTVLGAP